MGNTEAVQGKVQQILAANLQDKVQLTKDGGFTIRNGSSRLFIEVQEWKDKTLVSLRVPVLFEVPRSPELNEYVAYHSDSFVFGTLALHKAGDDEKTTVSLKHNLLGDFLDEEELMSAVYGLAFVADDVDDELKATFGGLRFHEDDDPEDEYTEVETDGEKTDDAKTDDADDKDDDADDA
ncbi:T3SS (YopN, CesT) and YbjN peptide-binding chaperone 1 [Gordonia sp. (in: high G+C Gram-positive bacteria)]|uniref:T3SS (YopN, CesT) and YbjN peptide-binding chaperone 1 n=1 Tax=Gordonia sp. (in: high G+C Gram-positive bacteria) TaxID=84139 RepID=UPI0039E442CD